MTAPTREIPLGQRIRWARKQKGLSMDRLAERIGTRRRQIIRWEQGVNKPGPLYAARLAEALEQPAELFEDGDEDEDSEAVLRHAAARLAKDGHYDLAADLLHEVGKVVARKNEEVPT